MNTGTSSFASFQAADQRGNTVAEARRTQPVLDSQPARTVRLTPREIEVLGLLCQGLPNKLISRRLEISSATVKCHISRILSELGVSSRLQAVVAAARCGLVSEASITGPEDGVSSMHRAPARSGLHGSVPSGVMSAGV